MRSRNKASVLILLRCCRKPRTILGNTLTFGVALTSCFHPTFAGVKLTVGSGTDLTAAATYGGATPTSANDVVINTYYPTGPAIFTIGTGAGMTSQNLSIGSLNISNNYAISIGNNSSSAAPVNDTLMLGGTSPDSVAGGAGGNTADLIYLNGTLSSLKIQGQNLQSGQSSGVGTLSIVLARTGNFEVLQSGAALNISASISDGGSKYGITKTGAGTLTLSGANTYSGGTTVSGGTLNVNAANALGTGGLAVNSTSTGAAASVVVNFNSSQTVSSLSSTIATASSGNNTAQVNIASGVGLADVQSGTTNYAGSISGSGTLNIRGQGAAANSALVNYTGNDSAAQTSIGANATLQLNNASGPALSGPVAVATGATLQLGADNQIATTNTPTAAAVTLNGGTLNANGHSDGAVNNPTQLATTNVTSSMGALSLGSSSLVTSTLDFGASQTGGGPFVLAFADSLNTLGSGKLNVMDYVGGTDALYIGTTNDLTRTQLGLISFNGYGVTQLPNGEIVPMPSPEPGSVVALLMGAGALAGRIAVRCRRAAQAV